MPACQEHKPLPGVRRFPAATWLTRPARGSHSQSPVASMTWEARPDHLCFAAWDLLYWTSQVGEALTSPRKREEEHGSQMCGHTTA